MQKVEKKVTLRKLVADDGKLLISRTLNEYKNPTVWNAPHRVDNIKNPI